MRNDKSRRFSSDDTAAPLIIDFESDEIWRFQSADATKSNSVPKYLGSVLLSGRVKMQIKEKQTRNK